jgi:hypothetical protein
MILYFIVPQFLILKEDNFLKKHGRNMLIIDI